jgi:hypothetical protein
MSDGVKISEPRATVQIEPLLLRKDEAAQMLSISPRLFDDLVAVGFIGKTKIGGVVAYEVDELRAFVSQAKREPDKIQAALEKLRGTRDARRNGVAKLSPGLNFTK